MPYLLLWYDLIYLLNLIRKISKNQRPSKVFQRHFVHSINQNAALLNCIFWLVKPRTTKQQKVSAPVLWKTLDAILRKQILDFMQGLCKNTKIILDKIIKGVSGSIGYLFFNPILNSPGELVRFCEFENYSFGIQFCNINSFFLFTAQKELDNQGNRLPF